MKRDFLEVFLAVMMFTILVVMMFVQMGLEKYAPKGRSRRCPIAAKSKNMYSTKYTQLKPKENLEEQKVLAEKLQVLAEKLASKERLMSRSKTQITETEEKLGGSIISVEKAKERQRLDDLKSELAMTEIEVSNLQDEIGMINTKRKELQIEMMKQKDVFDEAVTNLTTDLKKREMLLGNGKNVDTCAEGMVSDDNPSSPSAAESNTGVVKDSQTIISGTA